MDISQTKEHLTGMIHSGTLNKVRNFYAACERAANTILANLDPVETIRTTTLSQVIHDNLNTYPLPSDFKKLIDLYPQDNRTGMDTADREYSEPFSSRVGVDNKKIAIEGSEGSKVLRINWKSVAPKAFNTMNSLTSGGTISAVATAANLKVNTLYKVSGSGSIEFDVVASGDGIQCINNTALDLTTWNKFADVIIPIFLGSVANLTSVTFIFGNDLTTKFWTPSAQTAQADGTAFRVGWNYIKFVWSSATQTGTVAPATINSWKLTIQSTGAIANVRVDNIVFSLGRVFDNKYYSRFFFKSSAGTYLARPVDDTDTVIGEGDVNNIFLFELLKACAQQIEGEDSTFDIQYANRELHGDAGSPDPNMRMGLYSKYRSENPSMGKKAVSRWSRGPRFRT